MQQQSKGKTFVKTSRGKRERSRYNYKYCAYRNNKATLSSAVLTLSNAATYCLI
nr:MAG TPA: hypothetical protein [Caudoviricetes sp.]